MTLQCLVVDDEPIARSILEKYVARTPYLELAGSLDNALGVIPFLNEQAVDLMFLDINMPEFTGIDLLKSVHQAPAVIITTAYSEYGAESYEYEVIDYLLKPIAFPRFLKAIQKVPGYAEAPDSLQAKSEFIFLKEDHQNHKVNFADIRYVQAYGNYLKVFLKDKILLVRKTIGDMEEEAGLHLVRIHKSYLIAIPHIDHWQGNEVCMNGGETLPIGKVFKATFEQRVAQL